MFRQYSTIRFNKMRRLVVAFICATFIGWFWFTSTPVSRPTNAAWTAASKILDKLDTAVDDSVRSVTLYPLNGSVQGHLDQDADDQEILRCLSSLSQFPSCSWPHCDLNTTVSPVLSSSHGTRSPTKPTSCLCSSLAGKRLTMVGGEHVYRFHNLLLHHQTTSEGKQFSCLGREFCTHHHLCLPASKSPISKEQLMRYIRSPSVAELVQTGSLLVSYVLSDTLLTLPDPEAQEYSLPYIHPISGVRSRETYWLASARKADILILGRGPFSAPPPSYTGNWSFLLDSPSCTRNYHVDVPSYVASLPKTLQIVDAAVHATLSMFLPELQQTLNALRINGCFTRRKKVIWLASHPRFPGYSRGPKNAALLTRSSAKGQDDLSLSKAVLLHHLLSTDQYLEDPWTLFHDVQVYLQDRLLRQILPHFKVPLLQLDSRPVEASLGIAEP